MENLGIAKEQAEKLLGKIEGYYDNKQKEALVKKIKDIIGKR